MLKIAMKKETRNLLWLMLIVSIAAECFASLYLDDAAVYIFAAMAIISLTLSLYCYRIQRLHSNKV
jgi:hypothetical protein